MAKKKTVDIFNDKKAVRQDVLEIIFDTAINNRYPTLKAYFEGEGFEYNPKHLDALIKRVETRLSDQITYFSYLMYHHMETSGDWGEPGEQQVKVAFCRNVLKIPSENPIDPLDAASFTYQVAEKITELKINTLSAEAAKSEMKQYKFQFFGKNFEIYKSVEINRIVRFVGSKWFLHGGQYGASQEFILGEGKKTQKQGYDVIYLTKELVRTPNNVMSMAAIIGHRNIYIRMEALRTIFAQKWLQMFSQSEEEKAKIKANPFWDVGEKIKEKVLILYDISDVETLKNTEKQFLKDMAETILYHELGHGIIQHSILPLELGAIGEATKLYGENIYTAMLEFLADFAPPEDGLAGPLHNMITVSKTDSKRAHCMYFMYLSDVWFYNTEDTYMYTYSDLMCLILLKYVDPKGQVDFSGLEADLQFRKDRGTAGNATLFERVYDLFVTDAKEIKTMVEHASYALSDKELGYKKVRAILVEEFRKNDGFVHEDSYEFLVPFWTNMVGYVQKISNSKKQLEQFIQNQQRKNIMKMMVLSCGRQTAEKYQFDHRKYIIEKMKSVSLK